MNQWTKFNEESYNGFDIVASWTYEDLDPKDLFDDTVDDIKEIYRKIDNGTYTWFVLRVQAFKEGIELGSSYLGGMLYDNVADCLTDGTYSDFKDEAITEAKQNLAKLVATI